MKSVKLSPNETTVIIMALEYMKKQLLDDHYTSSRKVRASTIVWINNIKNKIDDMYPEDQK